MGGAGSRRLADEAESVSSVIKDLAEDIVRNAYVWGKEFTNKKTICCLKQRLVC
jgi:hypothetical protein